MTYVVARYGSGVYAGLVTVAVNLARLREQAGLSQSELGRRLDVPAARVWDWESGRYKLPDTRTLMRLATVLRVSVDDLLVGVDADYDVVVQARQSAPAPAKGATPKTKYVKRGIRLLEQMSEEGQRVAVGSIAAIVRAFPPTTQPRSQEQSDRKPSVKARKAHEAR